MKISRARWMPVWILVLIVAGFSGAAPSAAHADANSSMSGTEGNWGAERFAYLLGVLKEKFRKGDVKAISDSRDTLYRFEALLRLYVGAGTGAADDRYQKFPNLRTAHDQIKQVEDEIGALGQVESLMSGGHGDARALQTQESDLAQRLKQVLSDGGWTGKKANQFDRLEAELKHTDFGTPQSDRNLVLARVAVQLNYANDRPYDMHDVEGGIHELRRQTRWFRYYRAALSTDDNVQNSLLRTTTDSCPLTGPAPDLTTMASPGGCVVSKCLVDALNADESLLSGLKHDGAIEVADGKPPSPEMVQGAENVLKDLHDRKILSSLATQVQACMVK